MHTMSQSKFNTAYITFISLLAAGGGYLFGFDFAVISGSLPFLEKQFQLTPYWEGFATGSLALGAMVGCLIAGYVSDAYGRKPGLMIAAFVFLASSLAMAMAPNRDFFIVSRFFSGIGVGMASMLSPMYIAELAPPKFRGRLVAINQLTIVLGILITNLINYTLRNTGDDAWRWMFGLGAIPSGIFLIGISILPESPRWLVQKGKNEKALKVLNKIGNHEFAADALKNIEQTLQRKSNVEDASIFNKMYFPAVMIGIGLAIFQQFCGINTVFNYAPKLFESIGTSQDDQLLQTVFIGAVNVIFTISAMFLVDKIGRKPLMLIGAGGLAVLYVLISQLLASGSTMVSWFLLSAIGVYAVSLAPVTWVLISEIFPNKVRVKATTWAILCLWGAYFVLVFTFPILFDWLKESIFYIYAAICTLGCVGIWKFVKETKGKTLEEIEDIQMVH